MLREIFLLSPSDPWLWPGLFKCRPFQVKELHLSKGFELAVRKWECVLVGTGSAFEN